MHNTFEVPLWQRQVCRMYKYIYVCIHQYPCGEKNLTTYYLIFKAFKMGHFLLAPWKQLLWRKWLRKVSSNVKMLCIALKNHVILHCIQNICNKADTDQWIIFRKEEMQSRCTELFKGSRFLSSFLYWTCFRLLMNSPPWNLHWHNVSEACGEENRAKICLLLCLHASIHGWGKGFF